MNRELPKKLLPIVVLIILSFWVFTEIKNNIQLMKLENANLLPKESSDRDQEPKASEGKDGFDKNSSNMLEKLTHEDIQETENIYWEAVERKDSYNNELQFYSKENVVISSNSIEITSKKESKEDKEYTSGLVESTKSYKFGYFEFVIEISEGNGIFPAIWFMPNDESALPEIDVFEMIGNEPQDFYGVIHFEEGGTRASDHFRHKVSKREQYCIALKWEVDSIAWYIDGKEIFVSKKGVPKDYMYIIINQAIGGDWPGEPDDGALPSKFKIVSWRIEPAFEKGR